MAQSVRESEVKNRLKKDYFDAFDWTRVIGDIDLAVCSQPAIGEQPVTYLWAETKKGSADSYESLIQLILTIGKARTFEKELPPFFLAAADAQKIAFVEYNKVMHIFSKTDFNWNVTPSDHSSKEFKELFSLLHDELEKDVVIFKYAYDSDTLRKWIKKNFKEGRVSAARIPVNKNNFTFVYYDWVKSVKPSINVNWDLFEKSGVLDCDFYLADLMSIDDRSIQERLKVVLEKTKYRILRKIEADGLFSYSEIPFKDGMIAYKQFWNRYTRPPKPVYQKYILDRRDLLVPQNIREVKGSYYTPEIWVRKAQEYIEMVLGENWQEEYYVWDCAAGSGNLLRGLTNKYNIFASTLDDADVKIMHQAIDEGRLNLVKNNVFQFDFLNDDFSKCPEALQKIIADPEKRKSLVVFINPPYAEAANTRTKTNTGGARTGLSQSSVRDRYINEMGRAVNELFAQFYVRISREIHGCILAEFSKLKILQGPNFREFRTIFPAELKRMFIVPANTFDNVSGVFPIGFQIFDTGSDVEFESIYADPFDSKGEPLPPKLVSAYKGRQYIIDWFRNYYDKQGEHLAYLRFLGTDFQHNSDIFLTLKPYENDLKQVKGTWVTKKNIIPSLVYFAVRRCFEKNWMNDRDQFLYPESGWEKDLEFQGDCIMFSLFNVQNRISSAHGINHWIPFYEDEISSPSTRDSRLLADIIHNKDSRERIEIADKNLFSELEEEDTANACIFEELSTQAKDVYDSARNLWKYYMTTPGANSNASYYDIKAHFQGFTTSAAGKDVMNSDSSDQHYTELHDDLKQKMKLLAAHLAPKIFDYGFLLK